MKNTKHYVSLELYHTMNCEWCSPRATEVVGEGLRHVKVSVFGMYAFMSLNQIPLNSTQNEDKDPLSTHSVHGCADTLKLQLSVYKDLYYLRCCSLKVLCCTLS